MAKQAKAFIFLRIGNPKKLQLVYVGIRLNGKQFALSTGIKVLPKHWDTEKQKVKTTIGFPEIDLPIYLINKLGNLDITSFTNEYLEGLVGFVNERTDLTFDSLKIEFNKYLFHKTELEQFASDLQAYVNKILLDSATKKKAISKNDLIEKIEKYLRPPAPATLIFPYIESFIKKSESGERLNNGKQINEKSVQRYRTAQKLLLEFQKEYKREMTFENMDKDFIDSLNTFLNTKDYTLATSGKHVTTLKTFLREATEDGINTNLKYQSKAFKVQESESDSIALTPEEVQALYKLNFKNNERLDKVRDLFVIGCLTGLRFSDFTDIKPENIKQDKNGYYLEIIQYKTKNRVIVPVNDKVLAILNKYNNVLPEPISNQKFNDYLKEIAKLVPALKDTYTKSVVRGGKPIEETFNKYQMVSSHTARRTFCTNAYERGTPAISLMQISGHRTEKSFLKYIKTDKKTHAEIVRKHL